MPEQQQQQLTERARAPHQPPPAQTLLGRVRCRAQVTVEQKADGAQTITLTTPLQAGRLLLHWGVEGGKDYKGGWRLPSSCRPPDTKQYKDRALQSPFT